MSVHGHDSAAILGSDESKVSEVVWVADTPFKRRSAPQLLIGMMDDQCACHTSAPHCTNNNYVF